MEVVPEVVEYALYTAEHDGGDIAQEDFLKQVLRALDADGVFAWVGDAGPVLLTVRPEGEREKAIEILDTLAAQPDTRVVWIHGHP